MPAETEIADAAGAAKFRILSLDGGGAKGIYTLGVLKEIEGMIGGAVHERFDLVFGTSTGAIIAALVCLGRPIDEIHELYKKHVVEIMRRWLPSRKSQALHELSSLVFEDKDFTSVKTDICIVTTKWDDERPMIFKSNANQAYGRKGTFVPGFTAGDAHLMSLLHAWRAPATSNCATRSPTDLLRLNQSPLAFC
jgi:patatin-like phospholipase/acyl hydrolase